jgi:hypothetical protein
LKRLLSALTLSVLVSFPAAAAPIRTFVSSSGSDLNPCTVSSPCATIGHAVVNTAASGEVVILTSGAYDGTFTIDHSLKIYPAPGVMATIIGSGTTAVEIDGKDIIVTIRGLAITTNGAMCGIHIRTAGSVFVDDMTFDGNGAVGGGTSAIFCGSGELMVNNSRMRNGFRGVEVNPLAFQNVTIDHCLFEKLTGPAVHASNSCRVTVRDSVATHCYAAFNLVTLTSSVTELVVVNCLASYNQYGLIVGNGTVARLSRTTITNSTATGIQVGPTGTCYTFGNNEVHGNATNLTGALTAVSTM